MNQIRVTMALSVTGVIFLMKFYSFFRNLDYPRKYQFVFLSPAVSVGTFKRGSPVSWPLIKKWSIGFIINAPLGFLFWRILKSQFGTYEETFLWQAYLVVPLALTFTDAFSRLYQAVFIPTGWLVPNFMNHPLTCNNLSKFWSRGWNVWIADWYRENLFRSSSLRPSMKISLIFIFSAIWHDLCFTVPYFLITGENFMGRMTAYFCIQGAGVLFDRRVFRGKSVGRKIFFYLVVILPIPVIFPHQMLRLL